MIDEEATFEMFGYRSTELTPGSGKLIVAVCEGKDCPNPIRIVQKNLYSDLCASCAQKKRFENPDERIKQREAALIAQNKPEVKAKHVESAKKAWADPDIRARQSELKKKMWEDPNIRAKMVESAKKRWAKMTPDERIEHGILISSGKQGIPRDEFDGLVGDDRSHLKPINQCIQMNERFKGSDAHHLTSSIVIFIPSELHDHIDHSLKTGYNMGIMNVLALQFINGGL